MKRFNPETKTFKVFTALYNGAALTAAQAKKMGVGNLSAEPLSTVVFSFFTRKETCHHEDDQ